MAKNKMIMGIFDSVSSASEAVDDLTAMGYANNEITVVTREDVVNGDVKIENDTAQGIKGGATTGAVVGGVLGLLVGLGALAIPGVGALLITGPIATALGITGVAGTTASGALTGALAGGLVGALKELGLDEAKAKRYEDAIKDGSILVGVNADDDGRSEVENVFERNNAEDVSVLEMK
jgi:hypothetical protein